MSLIISLVTVLVLQTSAIVSSYIEAEANYNYKNPVHFERNNVVNKGVWVRHKGNFDKVSGNFLFRENSIDADNIIQRDFNVFGEASGMNSPFISAYADRTRRSADRDREYSRTSHTKEGSNVPPQFLIVNLLDLARNYKKLSQKKGVDVNTMRKHQRKAFRHKKMGNPHALRRLRKRSLTEKKCLSKSCENNIEDTSSLVKSKLITKIRPASVFNDYPYEIAILLGNTNKALDEAKNYSTYVINEMLKTDNTTTTEKDNIIDKINEIVGGTVKNDSTNGVPKRSMNNYESEVIKKIELTESLNNSDVESMGTTKSYADRDIPRKDDTKVWHQNAPIPDIHRYKVVSKNDEVNKAVRPVTERGLIKVLSMLTNTFKKIMKQHSDIKEIHKKLNGMNDDFMKNVEIISDKFQDFEQKYTNLVTLNQKIMETEEKLNAKEQHFKTKERELSKNLVEFEIQQKKFLTQQRQFYNIQKMMLAQNERINAKQNAIAKTQSEISHRQNNFARILKKAKQIYIDSKLTPSKITPAFVKIENSTETHFEEPVETTHSSNVKAPVTESVKINLFSIPTIGKLENQDNLLLNEKDEQPVDDLVYKYYFNNTFIDSLMKNFLSGFMSSGETNDIPHASKIKRDQLIKGTTMLFPINKEDTVGEKRRMRRWISHHSKKKGGKKSKSKVVTELDADEEKSIKSIKPIDNLVEDSEKPEVKKDIKKKSAFWSMAVGFCNEIGQNTTTQILDWCVEKALRRLENIELKLPVPGSLLTDDANTGALMINSESTNEPLNPSTETENNPSTPLPISTTASLVTVSPKSFTATGLTDADGLEMFFPDNDKLESNLKEYDLKPDTEGTIFFDGSMHASDVLKDNNSESDIMPGIESSSRIDNLDPSTLDTKAMRRAFLTRMKYESMLSKMKKIKKK